MIGLECNGVEIRLTRWTLAIAEFADRGGRFSSPAIMLQWLDNVFPAWREPVSNERVVELGKK